MEGRKENKTIPGWMDGTMDWNGFHRFALPAELEFGGLFFFFFPSRG